MAALVIQGGLQVPNPTKRLGRGLSAILSINEADTAPTPSPAGGPAKPGESVTRMIRVDQLRPNPFQPRRDVPPDKLKELAASIAKTGLIQPIAVRVAGDDVYEIIAGERRWRAAQMAGVSVIPAMVHQASDEEVLEMALVENIFREDLNAIDRATAYKRYCDEFELSAEDVAGRLGEDRTTVTNYLRLLELPAEATEWVVRGQLGMAHARTLLGLKSPSEIVSVARDVVAKELSVRAVEKLVRDRLALRASATSADATAGREKRPVIRDLEQAFMRAIGNKVEITESRRKGRGKIVIHYDSLDAFDRICERLGIRDEGRNGYA